MSQALTGWQRDTDTDTRMIRDTCCCYNRRVNGSVDLDELDDLVELVDELLLDLELLL